MKNKKIGIFDSGIGGLSILRELVKILPNESYLFYEDSIHNPYVEKADSIVLGCTHYPLIKNTKSDDLVKRSYKILKDMLK